MALKETLHSNGQTEYPAYSKGFRDGLAGRESACIARDAGDTGSIPGLGRSPGGGNGNLLQHSFLKNPRDRGAWQATQSMEYQELDPTTYMHSTAAYSKLQ